MDKNHRWYEVAKAWVEGAEIEFLSIGKWITLRTPTFIDDREYRIKNVHQTMADAFAKGAEIEYYDDGLWLPATHPTWHKDMVYRVKPKPDIIKRRWIAYIQPLGIVPTWEYEPSDEQLNGSPVVQVDFIFDGETGRIKSMIIPPQP